MLKGISVVFALLMSSLAWGHGVSAEDQARMLEAGYLAFIPLGAKHMITGYDHLLFLFGVMFFLTRFMDIVKFITAFTIGHSITLVFATLLGIKINYYLIDAVIALTVCYKAFDNLDGFKRYLQMQPPSLLWMVFGFGLIHGFGLSTRLQQLPLGDHGLVGKILAFNVGVEIGQIVALAIMLVFLTAWRKRESFGRFAVASNVALMIAGLALFVFQMHGFAHTRFPYHFPINEDDHAHIHEEMEAARSDMTAVPASADQPTAADEPAEVTQAPADAKPASEKKTHSHGSSGSHSH